MAEAGHRVSSFEDLEVFQRAYRASLEIHRESLGFPKIEQYALADQIRRASKREAGARSGSAGPSGDPSRSLLRLHSCIPSIATLRGSQRETHRSATGRVFPELATDRRSCGTSISTTNSIPCRRNS